MEHVLPDQLRWIVAAPVYGAALAAAMGAFFWIAKRRSWPHRQVMQLLLAGSVGGLLGAQLVQWLATGETGKTIEGGIVAGWLAVILAKRALKITTPTGDLFAIAIPVGEAVGRIGCFIGGCCYGKVATGIPWAVYEHGALRHPTQLYLSVLAAGVAVALIAIERMRIFANGGLFIIGGMLFCADRFIVEFFRDGATMYGSFTVAQYGCMIGFAVFTALASRQLRARGAQAIQ